MDEYEEAVAEMQRISKHSISYTHCVLRKIFHILLNCDNTQNFLAELETLEEILDEGARCSGNNKKMVVHSFARFFLLFMKKRNQNDALRNDQEIIQEEDVNEEERREESSLIEINEEASTVQSSHGVIASEAPTQSVAVVIQPQTDTISDNLVVHSDDVNLQNADTPAMHPLPQSNHLFAFPAGEQLDGMNYINNWSITRADGEENRPATEETTEEQPSSSSGPLTPSSGRMAMKRRRSITDEIANLHSTLTSTAPSPIVETSQPVVCTSSTTSSTAADLYARHKHACMYCDNSSIRYNGRDFNVHIRTAHPQESKTIFKKACRFTNICDYRSTTNLQVQSHESLIHGSDLWTLWCEDKRLDLAPGSFCTLCGTILLTVAEIKEHLDAHGMPQNSFRCTNCNGTFSNIETIYNHWKKSSITNPSSFFPQANPCRIALGCKIHVAVHHA